MERPLGEWWRRPAGGRDVWKLAWPLVMSTASWTLMTFVDRVYLTQYSKASIAAALPAGMMHFTFMCFPLGVAAYVNTFVAQYHGARRPERVGAVMWQGVFWGCFTIPLFLALVPLAVPLFAWAQHEPAIQREEIIYFRVLAYGSSGAVLAAALSSFFTGLGRTRIVLWVDVLAAIFNIVFDYLWIFGRGGFPEWGIFGAGLATTLGQWLKVVVLLAILMRREFRVGYALRASCRWDGPLLMRLLHYGGPSGFQQFVEATAFTIFLFLMGQLGEDEMAASNVAFSVNSLVFLPLLGMGVAVTTLVGHHLGAGRADWAERATWTSLQMAVVYTGAMSLLYFFTPDLFFMLHDIGQRSAFEGLRETCHMLLRYVALYSILDATHVVFVSAIKGAGDTRFVLLTTCLISPLPVILAWRGVRAGDWTLVTFWNVLTVWICALGLIYAYRFLTGPWRQMRVIESS